MAHFKQHHYESWEKHVICAVKKGIHIETFIVNQLFQLTSNIKAAFQSFLKNGLFLDQEILQILSLDEKDITNSVVTFLSSETKNRLGSVLMISCFEKLNSFQILAPILIWYMMICISGAKLSFKGR